MAVLCQAERWRRTDATSSSSSTSRTTRSLPRMTAASPFLVQPASFLPRFRRPQSSSSSNNYICTLQVRHPFDSRRNLALHSSLSWNHVLMKLLSAMDALCARSSSRRCCFLVLVLLPLLPSLHTHTAALKRSHLHPLPPGRTRITSSSRCSASPAAFFLSRAAKSLKLLAVKFS